MALDLKIAGSLTIAGESFGSSLMAGTAGYPNRQVMLDALEASGAEIVTVSIRRIDLSGPRESLVELLGGPVPASPPTPPVAPPRGTPS